MKEDEDILSFFRTLDHMVERLRSGTFRKVENQPQNLAGISE